MFDVCNTLIFLVTYHVCFLQLFAQTHVISTLISFSSIFVYQKMSYHNKFSVTCNDNILYLKKKMNNRAILHTKKLCGAREITAA